MQTTRRRSSGASTRYSSAHTVRSSASSNKTRRLNPDRDPEELLGLIFQLTTEYTQMRRPRMERPPWTVREARAALRSFVRKVGTLEGTPVWGDPEFQRELATIRDSATGRISHAALQHAFTGLKAFVEKWDAHMSHALHRRLSENRRNFITRR
jgi:hypothetical protein